MNYLNLKCQITTDQFSIINCRNYSVKKNIKYDLVLLRLPQRRAAALPELHTDAYTCFSPFLWEQHKPISQDIQYKPWKGQGFKARLLLIQDFYQFHLRHKRQSLCRLPLCALRWLHFKSSAHWQSESTLATLLMHPVHLCRHLKHVQLCSFIPDKGSEKTTSTPNPHLLSERLLSHMQAHIQPRPWGLKCCIRGNSKHRAIINFFAV